MEPIKQAPWRRALRKAVATFIFSTGGVIIGVNIFDVDFAVWKQVLSTGIGSLANLAYRWAEGALKEEP